LLGWQGRLDIGVTPGDNARGVTPKVVPEPFERYTVRLESSGIADCKGQDHEYGW